MHRSRPDPDLMMAAAGLRGVLVQVPETGGIELAVKSDALGVRMSTASARDSDGGNLEAAGVEVTRLRLGIESSRPFLLANGANLKPGLEVGARHDGGDAETGFNVDIGGSLAWTDPKHGVSSELQVRGLLSHEAEDLRERGISGSLAFDLAPDTERGLKLAFSQNIGATSWRSTDSRCGRATGWRAAAAGLPGRRRSVLASRASSAITA